MPLTEEEIQAIAAAENPAEHELVKPLVEKGFKIRTEEGENQFLDRYKNDVIEKNIPERIREVHTKYDEDIKGLTGIDRKQDEKSYEYLKRAVKEKETAMNAKIAELEEKAKKGGDPEGVFQSQIEELQAKNQELQDNLQAKADEVATIQGKYQLDHKKTKLMNDYNEVKKDFKKDLPDYFKVYENDTLEKILKNTKEVDGKLVPLNDDGTIKKDADLNPLDIKDVLRNEFKDVIDKQRPGGTGGTGSGGHDIDPETIDAKDFQVPASVKSQTQLMTHMLELGLERGTKKFNEIYKIHSKNLPLK